MITKASPVAVELLFIPLLDVYIKITTDWLGRGPCFYTVTLEATRICKNLMQYILCVTCYWNILELVCYTALDLNIKEWRIPRWWLINVVWCYTVPRACFVIVQEFKCVNEQTKSVNSLQVYCITFSNIQYSANTLQVFHKPDNCSTLFGYNSHWTVSKHSSGSTTEKKTVNTIKFQCTAHSNIQWKLFEYNTNQTIR